MGCVLRRFHAFSGLLFFEKTLVAKQLPFPRTFLTKCQGQIEAMGHRIISCVCQKRGFDMYIIIVS